MKLITETSYEISTLNEEKEKNPYIIGIFSTADTMVANGRIYEKDLLQRELDKILPLIEDNRLWGELNHPSSPEVNPERYAIQIKELKWDKNDLVGKALVLDTPCGQIVKEIIKHGKMGISSRGLGTVNEQSKKVNSDFKLITWDIVGSPSNQNSWVNGILEGYDFNNDLNNNKIEEIIEDIIENHWKMENPFSFAIYCRDNLKSKKLYEKVMNKVKKTCKNK